MIEWIESQALDHPILKGRTKKFCQTIKGLSDSLRPYFAGIGSFVQSNPEIPALLWGGVQFLFTVRHSASSVCMINNKAAN